MSTQIDNYKESNVAGSKHVRCKEIRIFNPYQNQPRVDFIEETAYILDEGEYILRDAGNLSMVIDMEDEIVDEQGQTITYGEMYKWMAIAYLQEAQKRDALKEQEAEQEAWRLKVQQFYDQFVVDYWDDPLYTQVDIDAFHSVMSENTESDYEEIVKHFLKDVESEEV